MANPLIEPTPGGILGPDPGRSIRVWVALLLRLGIGLSLLSSGLSGYFGMRFGGPMGGGGVGPWGLGSTMSMLNPFLSGLPYLAIGLGLALILGFLTTAAAIGAGFFNLIMPAFVIVETLLMGNSGGFNPGRFGNNPFLDMMVASSLPNLLTSAAMIWLSPLENNPFSVDAMIFRRDEIEPFEPRPEPTPAPDPIPEEEPPIRIGE